MMAYSMGHIYDIPSNQLARHKITDDLLISAPPTPDYAGRYYAALVDAKRARAWGGEGATPSDAATGALRKFLGDRRSLEYAANVSDF